MPTKTILFTEQPDLIQTPSWRSASIFSHGTESPALNLAEIPNDHAVEIVGIGKSSIAKSIFDSDAVKGRETSLHLLTKIDSQKVFTVLENTFFAPQRPMGLTGWLQPKNTIYFMEIFQAQQAAALWEKALIVLSEKFIHAKAMEMQATLLALLTLGVGKLGFKGSRGSGEALQFQMGFDSEKTVLALSFNTEENAINSYIENPLLRILAEMAHCVCLRSIQGVSKIEINIIFLHSLNHEGTYFCFQKHREEFLQTPQISQDFTFLPLDDVAANANSAEMNPKKLFANTFSDKKFSEKFSDSGGPLKQNHKGVPKELTPILTDAEPEQISLRRENEKLQRENQHLNLVNKALVKKIIRMQAPSKKEGGEAA